MSETEAPFYENIDEILAPPSQIWLNRGSGLLLGVFLLLTGVAALLPYQEEMRGTAYIQPLSVTVLASSRQPTTIGWITPGNGSRLRKGDRLLILLSAVSADTLRAPMDGDVQWLRVLKTGATLEANVPLCRIEGMPASYRLKIAFPGIDSMDKYIGKKITIRPENPEGMHFRPWQTEIISQPYLDPHLGVLVMDAQPPTRQKDSETVSIDARLPAMASAYLVTGKKSFLAFLINY